MPSPSSISDQQSVSNVQNRKRPNPYDTTQDSPPAKRIKSTSATGGTAHGLLLHAAQLRAPPHRRLSLDLQDAVAQIFATFEDRRTQSTKATTVSSRAKRSSAYDKDFEQNLIDHGIYPEGFEHTDGRSTPEPENLDNIDLSKLVIPTSHGRAPVIPNFFIEAKAPRGGADVAKRQACLDGAVGSRAMHSLQNYGEKDEPVYDGNSRTFSSTYHAGTGTLQLYAHHVTGPTVDGEQPEYHMTQIRTFGMTDTRETFIVGATALRNARDLAQQQRQTFIRAANARASQIKLVGTSESSAGLRKHDDTHVTTHCPEETAWQDSHDDLQKHIAEACVEGCEDGGDTPTAPQYLSASDESQDHGQDSGTDDPLFSHPGKPVVKESTTSNNRAI
ncbi:hypothetical protein MY11210_009638 [Beauveria gryllotalpidicola]